MSNSWYFIDELPQLITRTIMGATPVKSGACPDLAGRANYELLVADRLMCGATFSGKKIGEIRVN
jgi:hypothetical protein